MGYLITFRCYGTWFHGDERGSVDRRFYNQYGSPKIKPDVDKERRKARLMKHEAIYLDAAARDVVEKAIKEVCGIRAYDLHAINVRTEHVHVVVSNAAKPERMMNSFKAYATLALRSAGLAAKDGRVWSRHGSTLYLWTEEHISSAVDYVLNGQGGELPKFD
jgi:REP element-mobilizing transposase RayT